ncbi:hypothetical protein GLOIN_2v1485023 [Rhizophagus clarus]|uniref:RNase H type-1 domain-containing protein n=1 Tax=Rhizophagus clarus TaxID=94130 RepID=A0A8H3QWM0_9GLOM|nr:hypothetical protein GLOIN_2v1485023 [Rhizophagus clarus]
MRKAHDYLFKLQLLAESEKWEVQIIGSSVRNFVYQQASKMCKKDKKLIIRKAAAFSIHSVLQLVTQDVSGTLTWLQICDVNKRPARERIPRWFTLLSNLIKNAHNLENYYIISVEPNNVKRDSDINEKKLINMQAFKIIKKSPSIDNRKKEFVYMQHDHMLDEQSIDKATPYKVVQCCSGCALKDRRISKNNYNCYFNKDHTELRCINRISNHQDNSNYKVIKDILEIRNHLDKQQILEYTSSYIQMPDYDTALIQNTLASNEEILQHKKILHELKTTFNPSNTINIYTNGLLTDRFNADLNDFTKYMEWPSFTRAELEAILSAILVLQTGQKANIFTDSQAAINNINNIRRNLTNGKSKICTYKQLEIKFIKVKGHSGIKGNEEADRVAKKEGEKLTCITIKDIQQKDLMYDIYWDSKRVDRHIRKFIDSICEATLDAVWSLNRTHRSIFIDTTFTIEEEVT